MAAAAAAVEAGEGEDLKREARAITKPNGTLPPLSPDPSDLGKRQQKIKEYKP